MDFTLREAVGYKKESPDTRRSPMAESQCFILKDKDVYLCSTIHTALFQRTQGMNAFGKRHAVNAPLGRMLHKPQMEQDPARCVSPRDGPSSRHRLPWS